MNVSQVDASYNFKKSARSLPKFLKCIALEYKFCDKDNFCQNYKNWGPNLSCEKNKKSPWSMEGNPIWS